MRQLVFQKMDVTELSAITQPDCFTVAFPDMDALAKCPFAAYQTSNLKNLTPLDEASRDKKRDGVEGGVVGQPYIGPTPPRP